MVQTPRGHRNSYADARPLVHQMVRDAALTRDLKASCRLENDLLDVRLQVLDDYWESRDDSSRRNEDKRGVVAVVMSMHILPQGSSRRSPA